MLVRIQTGKTLIRLLLPKQSDLSLPCLSRPFLQASNGQNFRSSTVHCITVSLPRIICTVFSIDDKTLIVLDKTVRNLNRVHTTRL